MQISPELCEWIASDILEEEFSEKDALYGPGTNLRYGSALLSFLYDRYGVWSAVFAAYRAGIETTDAWMSDKNCVNEQGLLVNIPDKSVADYVNKTEKAVTYYTSLYQRV